MALLIRLAGLAIVTFFVVWACISSGFYGEWLSLPALLMMVGILIGTMTVSFGVGLSLRAFGAAIHGDRIDDLATFVQYLNVFNRAHQVTWASGLLVYIISEVTMLINMADPSSIGYGMAVASLPILYAVLLAEFIVNPLKHVLISRNPQAFEKTQSRVGGSVVTTVGFVAAALCLMAAQVFPLWLAYQEISPKSSDRVIESMREAFDHVDRTPPPRLHIDEDGSVTVEQKLERELRQRDRNGVSLTD